MSKEVKGQFLPVASRTFDQLLSSSLSSSSTSHGLKRAQETSKEFEEIGFEKCHEGPQKVLFETTDLAAAFHRVNDIVPTEILRATSATETRHWHRGIYTAATQTLNR